MNNKKKIIAGLLALFLGNIGVHWFYLNENKKGLMYLITTVCGWIGLIVLIGIIPIVIIAVMALIDAIKFLAMDEKKFNERYNEK